MRRATTASLEIAYEQTGPDSGAPIVLLHGFPYDIRQYDDVRDLLAPKKLRLIVPFLRGFGPTRYRNAEVFRSGQQAALGRDIVDLLDALKIERATLVGFDWGRTAACVAAALWPDRVRGLLTVGGYMIQNIAKSAATPQNAEQEHQLWYQWYFQTERGRAGLERNRDSLCKLLWSMWSPGWQFSAETFATTAASFRNPDFVDTVIHSYRHRYGNAAGDPSLEEFEAALSAQPDIKVATLALYGEDDRITPASAAQEQDGKFTGHFEKRLLPRVGHCPPAEAPEAVCRAIERLLEIS